MTGIRRLVLSNAAARSSMVREADLTVMRPVFGDLAKSGQFGRDNIFIHITGMFNMAWQAAADAGEHASMSVPLQLDASAVNVTPLNHATRAVVTLMKRSNVDTVIVAGRIRKWRGELIGFDVPKLRGELEASRDYLFEASGVDRDVFRN